MGGRVEYFFQPLGLDEDGQPVKKLYVCDQRLEVKPKDFEAVEVPFEILGTIVTDKASGFTGMAINFVRHLNGCFHVVIQPQGMLKGKNVPVEAADFDLRGCKGKMITQMSEEEKKESTQKNPSPTGDRFTRPQPPSSPKPPSCRR
jgi:hypothetical protein